MYYNYLSEFFDRHQHVNGFALDPPVGGPNGLLGSSLRVGMNCRAGLLFVGRLLIWSSPLIVELKLGFVHNCRTQFLADARLPPVTNSFKLGSRGKVVVSGSRMQCVRTASAPQTMQGPGHTHNKTAPCLI